MVFPKSTVKVVSKQPLGALGSIHAGPHHAAGGKNGKARGLKKCMCVNGMLGVSYTGWASCRLSRALAAVLRLRVQMIHDNGQRPGCLSFPISCECHGIWDLVFGKERGPGKVPRFGPQLQCGDTPQAASRGVWPGGSARSPVGAKAQTATVAFCPQFIKNWRIILRAIAASIYNTS